MIERSTEGSFEIKDFTDARKSLHPHELIESILSRSLFEPIKNLVDRPSKLLRAQLVQAGFTLAHSKELLPSTSEVEICASLANVLEAIHAGSLVIDDIQDESQDRRGSPCLHRIYGLSVALNAGNWLYFQPFEWIEKLGLPIEKELNLYRLSHEAMLKAHVGQALDLGTKLNEIDRGNAKTVCMTALRLKTGSLMSLALKMGACIAGASKERIEELNEFGTEFGVALQMFDDIGNFTLPLGDSKRLEDFRLKRPTWLWACAAENSSDSAYEKFLLAVSRIPNEAPLREWVDKNNLVAIAREQAKAYLESAFERFGQSSGGWSKYTKTRSVLNEIAGRIQLIYG